MCFVSLCHPHLIVPFLCNISSPQFWRFCLSVTTHFSYPSVLYWTTWKALNRLRTQVGRSRVNMSKWGYSNETETCDCGIRQTMQHLLVCPMMNTACSPQDLTTANDIAIGCTCQALGGHNLMDTTPGGRTRIMMVQYFFGVHSHHASSTFSLLNLPLSLCPNYI